MYIHMHIHMYIHMYILCIYICIYIGMHMYIHFRIIFTSLWGHFGVTLGSLWGHFGCHFGVILRSLWGQSGIILASFWRFSGPRGCPPPEIGSSRISSATAGMGQNPDSGLEIQPFYRIWLAGLEPDYLRLRSIIKRPATSGRLAKKPARFS